MTISTSASLTRPELLAPAGDWECVAAAIENGADAVYFGLDCGFNARARAKNFHLDELPELIAHLHRRGVAGYVTMNTLVFSDELPGLAPVIERVAAAGTDAVLVQDLGVARLVSKICPELEIHASTQMTLTSAETIQQAARLGIRRVVLPREMSLQEIRQVRAKTEMPLEAFVHGALCVAYSGQCLTSESLGGRSANRGQCAQACRLPYDLICDGEDRDLGDVRYLLSPQDLAAYPLIPELIEAGVCSLKIEGRLKTPEYVANITAHYRRAIDQAMREGAVTMSPEDVREMELSFSRGFSPGWLEGCDHKMLVPGTESAKRGVAVGRVERTTPRSVFVHVSAPLARGDGLAFDGDRAGGTQQGGRIFQLRQRGKDQKRVTAGTDEVEILFGHGDVETSFIQPGQTVWKTDDPQLNRRLRQSFAGEDPHQTRGIDFHVEAICGEPLRVTATTAGGERAQAAGEIPLEVARKHPAEEQVLRDKLGRLGGSPFALRHLTAEIVGQPMVPVSLLNQLRRQLVRQLEQVATTPPVRTIAAEALPQLTAEVRHKQGRAHPSPGQPDEDRPEASEGNAPTSRLHLLCRNLEQVAAAAERGADQLYCDFHDIRQYAEAIQEARQRGASIFLASVRIQKPGETGLLRVLTRHQPDGFLCRNLAALHYFAEQGFPTVADFSLNAANPLTVDWLRDTRAERVTASYDLNREQLIELVDAVPPRWLEVVIHQHMPMFHMEHCVFCAVMSPGTNKTNCGRPCDDHLVHLRDRIGTEHPLQADVACRNTLYNAVPQSSAEVVPELLRRGVRDFRVELLEQDRAATGAIIDTYRQLLRGERSGADVWRGLQAANRVGVTRGTMEERRNPLAIL